MWTTSTLPHDDGIHQRIQRYFYIGSHGVYEVDQVFQVSNPPRAREYMLCRHTLLDEIGEQGLNEANLFHGTKTLDAVFSILQDGFDWRRHGTNGTQYGKGSYFSSDLTYSAEGFTEEDDKGYRCMFIARVLLGKSAPARREHIKEPEGFHSTVQPPNIHVVFHTKQTYPQYLVAFKRSTGIVQPLNKRFPLLPLAFLDFHGNGMVGASSFGSYPNTTSDAKADWQWLDDGNEWVMYDQAISAQLETAFTGGQTTHAFFYISFGGKDGKGARYVVDLDRMRQVNQLTQFERCVRRYVAQCSAAWEWEQDQPGTWQRYLPEAASQMEAAVAAGRTQTTLHILLVNGGNLHSFRVALKGDTMTQVSEQYGKHRSVRRLTEAGTTLERDTVETGASAPLFNMSSSWFCKVNEFARQTDAKFKEKTRKVKEKYETRELQKKACSALSKAKEDTGQRLADIRERYESGELEAQVKLNWARVQMVAFEARIMAAEVMEKNRPLLMQLQEGLAMKGGGSLDKERVLTKVELWHTTDRIWAMPMPGYAAPAVAAVLARQFGDHFMVYNLSEQKYDYALFNGQVLEYNCPGHPAPPLGLLFKIVFAIAAWLEADARNVAVVHSLTHRGRTPTVLACLLAWTLEVDSPLEGLQLVADHWGAEPLQRLTSPSQRRYIQYFSSMMDGLHPQPGPWLLRRCIMNTIPKFALRDGRQLRNGSGCCPYLQVFQGGVLIFSTTWKQPGEADWGQGHVGLHRELGSEGQGAITLPWADEADGSVVFPVDTVVQGDILIRCRHLAPSGSRESMFRAAFHTGYLAEGGVLRLTKAQLDGACGDSRFEDDFFVDLIFVPIEKEEGGKEAAAGAAERAGAIDEEKVEQKAAAAGTALPKHGRGGESGLVVAAGAYDTLLAQDQGMWEAIAQRRQARAARSPRPPSPHQNNSNNIIMAKRELGLECPGMEPLPTASSPSC